MDEITYASAKTLSKAIREKKVSALEVVNSHLKRIEEVNGKLNAVVTITADRAIVEAKNADKALSKGEPVGALHGVPMTVKDSHDTEGIVSTGGTKGREKHIPKTDSTAVARMRSEGAIVLGKTNTPELTLSFETDNLIFGRTNNPYNTECTPGGSSGGAGAIIAAGGSPLDLGTDTGGSIRVPSSFCGITGLKPTSGRVPRTGHIISHSLGAIDALTTVGPMARYIEDLELVYPLIAGPDWKDPAIIPMPIRQPKDVNIRSLKVSYFTNIANLTATDDVVSATKSAVGALRDIGVSVTADMPEALGDSQGTSLLFADGGSAIRRLLSKWGTKEIHGSVDRLARDREPLHVSKYTELLEKIDEFRSNMLRFMKNYDAILCPVRPFPALAHGHSLQSDKRDANTYTSSFNLTGWPATVVRSGTSEDGLPIGIQIIARPWREDVCLSLGSIIELAGGGWKPPNI